MEDIYYIDVLLPRPLPKAFTYQITGAEARFLQRGMRVSVPFHGNKIYTGIVLSIHKNKPTAYNPRDIHNILDDNPVTTEIQLKLWEWIASYYMCTPGEVMRAAFPSAFLLQSDTLISLNNTVIKSEKLNDSEQVLLSHLQQTEVLDIETIRKILDKKNVTGIIQSLYRKNLLKIKEVVFDKYIPKEVKYLRVSPAWKDEKKTASFLDALPPNATAQRQAILSYFSWKGGHPQQDMPLQLLIKNLGGKRSGVDGLLKKGFFEAISKREDRVNYHGDIKPIPELNSTQKNALKEIQKVFNTQKVCLLHGITGSGKTETYIHLIEKMLQQGKQVLYLVPEISLTTQLIARLQVYFGKDILIYHSRYSVFERYEVWQNVLNHKQEKGQLIIGARSAVLLPYSDLGLIIVDEEHETSYKQFNPAPRYHARDTAIVLGKFTGADVLLGTATPSIESFHNTLIEKYGIVRMDKRYAEIPLPEIQLINLREHQRKKTIKGHFSPELIEAVNSALEKHEQIILFQNRRGYAPVSVCRACGHIPHCPNCDVSLTYHKYKDELRCHYCGHHEPAGHTCPACGSPGMELLGFGTQQIEQEVKELFPNANTARLDYDTTRGKYSFQRLINAFQNREIDILIGTQMLTKGLDFSHVSLVGVMQADILLNNPDFRAHERSYQMLVQVSGRAGRAYGQGLVLIQTYNPEHPVLQFVLNRDYTALFENEYKERALYLYPPHVKIIKITLKHKNPETVVQASGWLANYLKSKLEDKVLGPAEPQIGRIKNLYIREIMIKIVDKSHYNTYKKFIFKGINHLYSVKEFSRIRLITDVDPQ